MTRTLAIILMGAVAAGCGSKTAEAPTPEAPSTAKNVILFVGDGMGISTVTATRIFDGQSKGMQGEENVLSFEKFPNVAMVKVYNTNQQVPDSAGTATAMMTGSKTRAGMINVGPAANRGDCSAATDNPLTSLGTIAKQRGKAVGFVTTTRVTHATPATVYARTPERDWEFDTMMPAPARDAGCRDVARQLVDFDQGGIDVAMGGSSKAFFGYARGGARREADADLVREWLSGGAKRRHISSAEQLATLEPGNQVLGLFAESHMTYIAEREDDSNEPMLTDMALAAIDVLSGSEDGYFLMVEGGRIDHAHHDGRPGWALLEAQEFAHAIAAAVEKVDLSETLILVTADHSHVFTMGGYATRGNPILGYVRKNDMTGEPLSSPDLAADGQPYTTLAYANGPGAVREMPRPRPETGVDALAQSLVPIEVLHADGTIERDETHGGEDVTIYGIGPGSDAVRGVMEQNLVFDIMMDALGWSAK